MRWRKLISLLVAVAVLGACTSTPPPQPEAVRLERPQDALDTACRAREAGTYTLVRRMVICDLAPFLTARDSVIDTWGIAAEFQARLAEERTHHGADRAVDAGRLAAETARADRAENAQWIWGSAGLGIGAALVAIIAALAAR